MAGLIQQQIAGQQPAEETTGQMPMGEEPMTEGDDEVINENDPGLKQAIGIITKGLYEAGAAEDLAQALQAEEDVATAMADNAYKMVSIAIETVEIDDEMLPMLAIVTLQEMAEIAEAAGIKLTGTEVAEAFRMMLMQFLEENGADISEIEAATANIDPAIFEQAAAASDEAAQPEDGAMQEEIPA